MNTFYTVINLMCLIGHLRVRTTSHGSKLHNSREGVQIIIGEKDSVPMGKKGKKEKKWMNTHVFRNT
jgi:hypothetical protein